MKASEKALSSIVVTAKSGVIVGKDTGEIDIWRFSSSEYPTLDIRRRADQLAGNAPVSKLVLTPDKKFLVAGSWSNQVFTLSGGSKMISSRMQEQKDWVVDVCATQQDSKTVVYSISLDRTLAEWPMAPPTQKGKQSRVAGTRIASIHCIHLELEGKRTQPWLLAVCDLTPSILAMSDSSGRILLWSKTSKQTILTKKVHQSAINTLATINGCLVSGSDDSTVKVWKLEGGRAGAIQLKQIGHFHCQSCVTTIAVSTPSKSRRSLLLVGDSLGHVMLLEWHQ